MIVHSWAFVVAGCIGASVALLHGVLMQRLMVVPILAGSNYPETTRRLLPVLLQFSTFCWFLGGIALIATPVFPDRSSVLTTALVVASFYLFGAVGNFWGTRGRHPGWALLTVCIALIAWGSWRLTEA